MMYALHQGLTDLLETGLNNTLKRHQEVHQYLVDNILEIGLEFLVEKDFRIPSLNSVPRADLLQYL